MSFNGNTEDHYVSGMHIERDTCKYTGGLRVGKSGLKMGARTACWGSADCKQKVSSHSQFIGDIDEGMLYSTALNQAEIYSIYKRAYDSSSGSGGVTFIRAPSKVDLKKLPSGLVGFWPLDGDGKDISDQKMSGTTVKPDWVAGVYNLAFRFDGNDAMVVPNHARLQVSRITMSAWIRPVEYDIKDHGDRGIIMNKEGACESSVSRHHSL